MHGAKCYSTFSTEFDDFFITSIGGESQTAKEFWGILLNFQFTPVGGCQQEVKVISSLGTVNATGVLTPHHVAWMMFVIPHNCVISQIFCRLLHLFGNVLLILECSIKCTDNN